MATSTIIVLLCLITCFVHQLQFQFSPVWAATTMADKSEIFTVYQHDHLNETGYAVVTGPAGAPFSDTTRPFGTIYVFRDDLTLHNDSSSAVVGVIEGSSTTTSFDGLRNLLAAKITLHHRGYRGSVSVLGGTHNTKPSVYPVVGGTGDFLYTVGYVRQSPVDSDGPRVTYKLQINLYWPPYVKFAPVP
ncbi:uncharacterized protein LOC133910187 [Phragmites australis]|uniref:uncharacterized protein LOC133910187 n=1 Tax=Phragmites australis TaxID=29695 RepID=UPI002D777BBE|nr:uncharacterized protein LOC133910187 [Phragmites australis]